MMKSKRTVLEGFGGSWSLFGLVALTLSVWSCGGCGHDAASPVVLVPPAVCAPPDPTSTSFYDGVSFLFQSDCATQKNVDPAAFTRARVAVLRGHVVDDTGKPLSGVAISAPRQPTWGTTTSSADGAYAFAVQGGGKVVLRFELQDHIAAQRGAPVAWNRVALLDDVALLDGEDIIGNSAQDSHNVAQAASGGKCPVHDMPHNPKADPDARPHYHANGRPKASGMHFTVPSCRCSI